jgi:hypothetical protein
MSDRKALLILIAMVSPIILVILYLDTWESAGAIAGALIAFGTIAFWFLFSLLADAMKGRG